MALNSLKVQVFSGKTYEEAAEKATAFFAPFKKYAHWATNVTESQDSCKIIITYYAISDDTD